MSELSLAEQIACLKHWYECKGCPLCQGVRDHYAREDAEHAELVKRILGRIQTPEAGK